MTRKVDVSLIIPAYNEVKSIGNTLQEAQAYFESRNLSYEIIISADGDDGTYELVQQMSLSNPQIKCVGSKDRGGKGLGIRRAVPLAVGRFVGFADADNKTPITEFDKFLPMLETGCEIVIGSRGMKTSVIQRYQKWYRRIGSKGFGIFMHLIVGLPGIIDTQCGFKFFQRAIAIDLFSRQRIDGYMFDVEILYLAQQSNYRIEQIPIAWRDDGDTRLQLLRGNIQNALDVFRIRFNNLTIIRYFRQSGTANGSDTFGEL